MGNHDKCHDNLLKMRGFVCVQKNGWERRRNKYVKSMKRSKKDDVFKLDAYIYQLQVARKERLDRAVSIDNSSSSQDSSNNDQSNHQNPLVIQPALNQGQPAHLDDAPNGVPSWVKEHR